MKTWAGTTFDSLRIPNYRKFFFGQAISVTGTWMQSVATAWLVLQLTNSPSWLGAAIALQYLPVLLFGPYGGVVVDRMNKRTVLYVTQSMFAVLTLTLGVATITGWVSLGTVLGISLCLGLVTCVDWPARQAFVRDMVPAENVHNAVALNTVLANTTRAIGPAVAGILIGTIGLGVCFVINSASYVAIIVALLLMNAAELHTNTPVSRAKKQLREGLGYVRRTSQLGIPLLMVAIVGVFTYEFQVSIPSLIKVSFGFGAETLGAVLSIMGVGGLIGGLIVASRATTGVRTLVRAAAVFGLCVLGAAAAPNIVLCAVAFAAVGASSVWFMSTSNATLQLNSASQMRGRVMALWTVGIIGSTAVGAPLVGIIGSAVGPRWAVALGGLAALAAAGVGSMLHQRGAGSDTHVPSDVVEETF